MLFNCSLTALSAVDGRYANITAPLCEYMSEWALMKMRCMVEINWLKSLAECKEIKELKPFSKETNAFLDQIIANFNQNDGERIKNIEKTTNHDVKAVEYFLKERLATHKELATAQEFVHFALTSEDINNVAYSLMLKKTSKRILFPEISLLNEQIKIISKKYANIPMLARTHGQAASPTTLGKEMANFFVRLTASFNKLEQVEFAGKINGAVGNFNAHVIAYPEVDWPKLSEKLLDNLGLKFQLYTTQIEPHDNLAEFAHNLCNYHNILIDLSRDIWGYISLGYFKQKNIAGEIGSSTMPHKINPIDFENAEGNLGIANSLLQHFANKLPISRWQRDLSDSTVLRTLGTALGHTLIALKNLQKGISKIEANKDKIAADLNQNWEVLAEAVQTVMRRYGLKTPYEQLKELTRGKKISQIDYQNFINSLQLPEKPKETLMTLTPSSYIGLAKELAESLK